MAAGRRPAVWPRDAAIDRPAMDNLKAILARPIQLAEQVIKFADEARTRRHQCQDLKTRVERVATMLRQAARADLYDRPARRVLADVETALDRTGALLHSCRRRRGGGGLVSRVFTIVPASSFRRTGYLLDNSIGNLSWLLRVSNYYPEQDNEQQQDDDEEHQHDHAVVVGGLPPIAQTEPILFLIWEQIAVLQTGGLEERGDAAASMVSLARDNDRYGKLIIEEDGVPPLLRLIKEGGADAQESAALAIGLLARDPACVDLMIVAGVCASFAKILKDANMKVQGMVAWAVSELAANHPKCQDAFLQHNVIRLLISHLAFETVQEHSKYAVASSSKMSISSVVMDKKMSAKHPQATCSDAASSSDDTTTMAAKPTSVVGSLTVSAAAGTTTSSMSLCVPGTRQPSVGTRESEDPEIKAYLKAHAARALCTLATGNAAVCRSITESRALLCLSVLLEKGAGDVRYNSAMALLQICRVAERNAELRRSAFKPTSPAARAVVDQLVRVVDRADHDDELLVPCVTSLGCLSRTFRATETRVIIGPLVRLLDDREDEVTAEAAVALAKFACVDNYLHAEHSRAIVEHGGARHLVQLGYFREQPVQTPALVLVCYIVHNIPDSEELAQAGILTLLEWASKQGCTAHDPVIANLLPEAKIKMELFQSRGAAKVYY